MTGLCTKAFCSAEGAPDMDSCGILCANERPIKTVYNHFQCNFGGHMTMKVGYVSDS